MACWSMLKEELVCDWVLFFSLCLEWCSPVRCQRCIPICCHWRCSLWSVVGAGIGKCWYWACAFSNIVHTRLLFSEGSSAGVIVVDESKTVFEGSNTMFLWSNTPFQISISLKLHQLSHTNSRTKPLITNIFKRPITRWSICYHADIHNPAHHFNPLASN